jgi:hypothetical protein
MRLRAIYCVWCGESESESERKERLQSGGCGCDRDLVFCFTRVSFPKHKLLCARMSPRLGTGTFTAVSSDATAAAEALWANLLNLDGHGGGSDAESRHAAPRYDMPVYRTPSAMDCFLSPATLASLEDEDDVRCF